MVLCSLRCWNNHIFLVIIMGVHLRSTEFCKCKFFGREIKCILWGIKFWELHMTNRNFRVKLHITIRNFGGYNLIFPKWKFMSFSEFCLNIFVSFKWVYYAIPWQRKKIWQLHTKNMATGRMSVLRNFLNLFLLKYWRFLCKN